MSRKAVNVTEESYDLVSKLAAQRELNTGEAADHMIRVGYTRIKALATHAKKKKKEGQGKAKKKAVKVTKSKPKANAAKPRKPKASRSEQPAQPAEAAV